MKIELKGWAAVPAILLIALFVGYRMVAARSAFDGQQGEQLRAHLQAEYVGPEVRKLLARKDSASTADDAGPALLIAPTDIQFTSVGIKGSSKEAVAKVTILVAGKTPPDGRGTRYYLMRHRTIGGWHIVREVGALSYYLKLF